jgi:hypothetical protein
MKFNLKSFFSGFGRALDLFATQRPQIDYNEEDGWKKDAEALASDWAAVGNDMRKVMNDAFNENKK